MTVKVCAVAQLADIKPRPAISADRRKRLSLTFTASEQKTACRSPGAAVYVYQKCYGASTRPPEGEAPTSSSRREIDPQPRPSRSPGFGRLAPPPAIRLLPGPQRKRTAHGSSRLRRKPDLHKAPIGRCCIHWHPRLSRAEY